MLQKLLPHGLQTLPSPYAASIAVNIALAILCLPKIVCAHDDDDVLMMMQ
jgi:hypothetical protein